MKSPITYYGGKQLLASTILGLMPAHKIYCEPYFGGGAVFFAKGKSYLEVINDHNSTLMTFYSVCRDKYSFAQLQTLVQTTLHSEKSYRDAFRIYRQPEGHTAVDIAWAVWMVTNMSYSASPSGGWKWDNGTAGSHSAVVMDNYRKQFNSRLFERLRLVQISSRDALEVIRQRDTKETFFYLDPPYPGCEQKHYSGFSFDSLEELLTLLHNIEGRFILSNFDSPMLRRHVKLNGWNVKEVDMAMRVSNFNEARRKKEVLVYNYMAEPQLFSPEQMTTAPYDHHSRIVKYTLNPIQLCKE